MNARRIFMLSSGVLYALTSMVLLYYFAEYILMNLIHLIRYGSVIGSGLSPVENYYFDLLVFFFFISSLSFTLFQLFSIIYPEITKSHISPPTPRSTPFEVLLYISTEEEAKVLQAIKDLAPRAYKFEIARKTGLSRMKVHRIIQRFESRGIVQVTKIGRNSQVTLSSWLI